MTHRSHTALEKITPYLKPRYVSWILSNIAVFLIVVFAMKEVTVREGQGGVIDVFIWPAYWGYYYLADTPFFITPMFEWHSLLLNYLYGFVPLFVGINACVNAFTTERFKQWKPSFSILVWSIIYFFLLLMFIPSIIFGFSGVILWVAMTITVIGVSVPNLRHWEPMEPM